jgi:hypothetical protein
LDATGGSTAHLPLTELSFGKTNKLPLLKDECLHLQKVLVALFEQVLGKIRLLAVLEQSTEVNLMKRRT